MTPGHDLMGLIKFLGREDWKEPFVPPWKPADRNLTDDAYIGQLCRSPA